MKTVNLYFIDSILTPFFWLYEAGSHDNLDMNVEGNARQVIREYLKPEFESFDPVSRTTAKESLRYALNKSGIPWDDLFHSAQPPFGPPDDPRQFFIWLWEELFPGESYFLESLAGYEEHNDLEATNLITRSPK